MKPTSYWLDTSQPFDRGSSKPLGGRYDVAVVGGGMTGSSAALALAKKGARVALLEADTIGNAASGRNGGMCNNGFAQNHAVMAGKDAANALYKAFDAGVDMVEVMDGRPNLNPWKDFDWPEIPGYFGRPWSLPILGAYYRMKDLVT
jgi:2-polyprenyl-6-methoxyphenol hydroxylase-like FAD-dependent oxidoreductase